MSSNLLKNLVIIKPVITEKSLYLYNYFKKCTFLVNTNASKKQISFEFEKLFGLKPKSVSVVNSRKNKTIVNRKSYTRDVSRIRYKKAYIDIGDSKLDIFENIK